MIAKHKKLNNYEIAINTIHEICSKCDKQMTCSSAHNCKNVMEEYKRRLAKEIKHERRKL